MNTGVKHDLEEFKVAQNSRSTEIENKHLTLSENLKAVSHRLDEAMTLIKKLEKMAIPNRIPSQIPNHNAYLKAIYFHYVLSKTQRSLGIVKFNHMVSDFTSSENGYNPSSGKFLVP